MKKLFYICVLFAFASCTNGLNKPITEELTAHELRVNIIKDSSFEDRYNYHRPIADWINADNLRKAKYGNITYKDIETFYESELKPEQIDKEHLELFPAREKLRHQADSLIQYFRSVQPDSLIALSFVKKTVRHTWLRDEPEFYIKITPLKGPVEQFDFEYYFSDKIDGDKNIDDIPFSLKERGKQRSPITKEGIYVYIGERYSLTNIPSDDIIRDYNFIYKITNVRYNGVNWNDLPYEVRSYVDKGYYIDKDYEGGDDIIRDVLIKECITKDYIPYSEYFSQRVEEHGRKNYPTISEMYDEYWRDYYEN